MQGLIFARLIFADENFLILGVDFFSHMVKFYQFRVDLFSRLPEMKVLCLTGQLQQKTNFSKITEDLLTESARPYSLFTMVGMRHKAE